ncbi:MAG TPA: TOMM precursor leader peptide-binding protein [Methylomirabilota bacterium]|jgi:bacteriocin biosynthesis cyclodehydratase domain-containing protein|nr:TOMM precursor leader peptide-binding protein [Methylomirabilota bacterium]
MESENVARKLKILPVQFAQIPDGVVLTRGCVQVKIGGEQAVEIVQAVLALASGDGATKEQICEFFAAPDRPAVADLIDQLAARRMLVPAESAPLAEDAVESNLEIFYWHFGKTEQAVVETLEKQRIAIVGVNAISRQLVASLGASGVREVEVIDYPLLRNARFFANGALRAEAWPSTIRTPIAYERWTETLSARSLSCLVATSDFGGFQLMREWNEFCVANQRHFLPIVLDKLIGYVGPLVVPGETACYECLRARENAAMEDPDLVRTIETAALTNQAVVGFHPAMASILGDIATMELTKFYGGLGGIPWKVGTLIEVSLLAAEMKSRKLLKLPRCTVCSAVNRRSATTPNKMSFMPGHDWKVITGEH